MTSYIQFCVETCIPTKTVRSFGNSKPWFNKELAALRKKKNSAYLSGDKEAYKSAKYQLRSAIKKAKSIHAKKLEDQFKENNTREVWKNIQQLTNYKKRSPPAADEDPDLPNKLNHFYARFDTANHFTSPGPPPPPPPPPLLPPAFIIEEDKVRTVFKRSNKRKSAGPDHLSPAVLSYCADQLAPVFTDIFNDSLRQCSVPQCFKTVNHHPRPQVCQNNMSQRLQANSSHICCHEVIRTSGPGLSQIHNHISTGPLSICISLK